tara:strand:- start:1171 stop:1899 length:729 start_codon:yes stop_codon:yes gene_type:complete
VKQNNDELTTFLNGQPDVTSMGIEQSIEIGSIATALAKAQKLITGAEKNATNPHFKSGYADLHSVIESCRVILSGVGIAFIQGFWHNRVNDQCHVYVTTQLVHTSGEWIRSMVYLPTERANPQGIGSAVTYGRRYGLSGLVGIAQYDDDGAEASMPYQKTQGDLARFVELKDHKAFTGKKTTVKKEWENAITMSGVHSVLSRMQLTVDAHEKANKPKTLKGDTLVVTETGDLAHNSTGVDHG